MDVYLVVVHDTIVQSREYAVLADSSEKALENVLNGFFLTESEPTTMETKNSVQVSVEKVGTNES